MKRATLLEGLKAQRETKETKLWRWSLLYI